MFMQRVRERTGGLFGALIFLGAISFIGKVVYEVARGNGLGTFIGGPRGVTWNWVSVLVLLVVAAAAVALAAVVGWVRRRRGGGDELG